MAAFPYSCQTGEYTIDQLGGEDCAKCGRRFQVGEKSRPAERIAEWQLFVHVECPKVLASLTIHGTCLSLAQAAELLALAPDVPPVMTDDAVRDAIGAVLDDHHGDVAACLAELAYEYGEHPGLVAARMSRTVVYTSRLMEVTP